METNCKNWKKSGEGNYTLYQDQNPIGDLSIQTNLFKRKAVLRINDQTYTLRQTGFWQNNIEIVDAQGQVVLKTRRQKWYSNTAAIEFEGRQLHLVIRNNPLVEFVILEHEREILSYGLAVKEGKVVTRIQAENHNRSYLLDFYLWYLFAPVAHENMGEDVTFLLLSTA